MAIILALMVGFIQFSLGISRLGFLIKFLSHPVIQGFTSAAAIIIGISQLKHLLGIKMVSSQYLQDVVRSLVNGITEIHFLTFFMGLTGIGLLIILKKVLPKVPGPLIVVTLSILVVSMFHLDDYGVEVIGMIPSGLPLPAWPQFDISSIRPLLPSAFAIALISFMESLAVARSIQSKHKYYKVDTNKELIAIGLANMGGSLFKSFPVSGGFSRSAVNDQAGARTGMSSVISALLVVITLVFMTPLLYYLPNTILASIILVAIIRLIHLKEARYLWKVDRKDFLMMLVTFIATLFLGIGTGIGIGVLLSLAWIIFEASYPHYAELGRVPGTFTFRNIKRFKDLDVEDDILIFRFDAPLFFANADRFHDVLFEYVNSRPVKVKAIIVDMESINTIDTSALHILKETIEEFKNENILLLMAEIKGPVRDKFQRSGLTNVPGEEMFFVTIQDALDYATGKRNEVNSKIALQSNK
jgi:sulfate permease, SulP family